MVPIKVGSLITQDIETVYRKFLTKSIW